MAEGNNIRAALEQIKNVKLNLSIDRSQVEKLRKSLDMDDTIKKMQKSVKSMTDKMEQGFEKIQETIEKVNASAEETPSIFSKIGEGFNQASSIAEGFGSVAEGAMDMVASSSTSGLESITKLAGGLSSSLGGIGTIIEGIVGVVGIISELAQTNDSAAQAAKELEEATAAAGEELDKQHEEFADSLANAKVQAEEARLEISNLQQLWNEGIRGDTWNKAVEEAIEKCPELEEAVKKVNGEWQLQQDEIDGVIQKIESAALAEAYKNEIVKTQEKKIALEQTEKERVDQLREKSYALTNDITNYEQKKQNVTTYSEMEYWNNRSEMAQSELKRTNEAIQSYESQMQEYDNDIAYYSEQVGAITLEAAQQEQAEEQANFGNKHIDAFNTEAGEILSGYQPDINMLSSIQGRLAQGVSQDDLASIVQQLRASDFEISDADAGSAERVAEIVAEALTTQTQEAASEIQELSNTSLAQIDSEIQDLRNKRNSSETTDEQKAAIDQQIQSLESQKTAIQEGIAGMTEVFSTNVDKQNTAVNNLATTIRNYTPTVNVVARLETSGTGQASVSAQSTQTKAHALGTSFYPGGVTTINEQGDEMVELPTGSRIYPARESGRMYQRMNQGNYNISISDIVIREEADIDRIVTQIVNKLERARRNFA